jgi:hypothetical protein
MGNLRCLRRGPPAGDGGAPGAGGQASSVARQLLTESLLSPDLLARSVRVRHVGVGLLFTPTAAPALAHWL